MTRLLSPSEAAEELCISEKHLRYLTCQGQIRYINIGMGSKRETRRYDPDDLRAFREARACLSTRGQDNRNTRTTSVIVGIDFQARRDARRNAKQSALRKTNASKHEPQQPTEPSP